MKSLVCLILILSLLLPFHVALVSSQTSFNQFQRCTPPYPQPILPRGSSWDYRQVYDPCIIETDTELIMFYSGMDASGVEKIGRATSNKEYPPVNWMKYSGNPIFSSSGSGFDSWSTRLGSVIRLSSGIYSMYYTGNNGAGIGLATSSDGITFTRSPSNPILSPTSSETAVYNPDVIKDGDTYYMYYTYSTAGVVQPGIKVATSNDGVSFSKQGEVLSRGSSGEWDDHHVEWTNVVKWGDTFYMVYEAYGSGYGTYPDDGTPYPFSLGVAYSSSPTSRFTKYSNNPILTKSGLSGTFDVYHVATGSFFKKDDVIYLFYCGASEVETPYTSAKWAMGLAYPQTATQSATLRVYASYQSQYVMASVTISGPEVRSGTTTTNPANPLQFTNLALGTYTVSGNYLGMTQTKTATVVAGQTTDVNMNFGGELWDQIVEFINQLLKGAYVDSRLIFLVGVAVFGVLLWYGNKRLSKRAKTH